MFIAKHVVKEEQDSLEKDKGVNLISMNSWRKVLLNRMNSYFCCCTWKAC